MKRVLLFISGIFLFISFYAQDYAAYSIFTSAGKKSRFEKVLKEAAGADIILFGELHNDPVAHWLQLKLLKDLPDYTRRNIVAGAEMFETDNQVILDEYFAGMFDDKRFEEDARLWTNYSTDYKPLLLAAREKGIRFVATNIPRRYANMVSKGGFESLEVLSEAAKFFLPPLPVPYDPDVPAYKGMMEMNMGHGAPSANFPKAQAIKDATMAHFILMNLTEGGHFLHFNGAYHSDNYDGIVWYLNAYRPGLRILTITTVLQEDTEKLNDENAAKADFIIVVPDDMTRTY